MFVYIIFNSVWVAEWPPFGKELPTRMTIYSLCSCNFSFSRFGFEGGIWVLIAPVPGHCILVTFLLTCKCEKDRIKNNTEKTDAFPPIISLWGFLELKGSLSGRNPR